MNRNWQRALDRSMRGCIDKITCVHRHKLIVFCWNKRVGELEAQLSTATNEQDEQYRSRKVEWMLSGSETVVGTGRR